MIFWNQAPLVRLLISILTGIIAAVYSEIYSPLFIVVAAILFIVIGSLTIFNQFTFKYKFRWIYGFILNIVLFFFGFQLTILNTSKFQDSHFSKHIDKEEFVYVKVMEPSLEKERSLKIIAEVIAVKQSEKWLNTTGKSLFYFQKDSLSKQISYGDCLLLKTKFDEIKSPQNPSEFNYKRYISFHQIYQQAYVKSENWKSLNKNEGNIILKYSLLLRDKLLSILTENKVEGKEFAVSSALLVGYEDKLDADIISAYASTGALHVLSVSGLHVAIVYIVFNLLLFPLDKIKYGNSIKAALLILFLWFYAALTGLSPSVLRASTMFSFIIISKAFNRYTNIYNTLAASALFLLLINPYLIMDVGFQLSYLAVIGIVYLQPIIYEWWEPKNGLLEKIWAITSVSIAAQVATFPLGLHYFHQFPNYFLFSNLIVIPLSTIIIYLGIAVFVVSKISLLAGFLAQLLSWLTSILNQSVEVIEHLPYANFQGISVSITETWLLYFLIIMLLAFFAMKQIQYLRYTMVLVIAFFGIQLLESYQEINQKKFIVYNIPKISAYDFIQGKQVLLLADSSLIYNDSRLLFHLKHNWYDLGIKQQTMLNNKTVKKWGNNALFVKDNFVQFYHKRIAIINALSTKNTKEKINVDYLILSRNPQLKIADLAKHYVFKKIIIDSSNSNRKTNNWKKECDVMKINYYSVAESGAFIDDLNTHK